MSKTPDIVATYIAAQPDEVQPALREIHAIIAKTFPQARVEMFATGKGELPIYKEGEIWRGGFSVRAKGPMVYVMDAEVVAKYKPQLGSLAPGNNTTCVSYRPTKMLDAAALKQTFEAMFAEAAAKQR